MQAAFNAASCGSPPTQMNDTEGFGGSDKARSGAAGIDSVDR
jgi:hypothetical protein